MKEAITRIHEGLNAALDTVVLIEVACAGEAPPARLEGIQLALTDLADGFRGLATLADTTAGNPSEKDRRVQRMAKAAARVVFDRRGNNSEAHLSEAELTGILEATILLALELR